MMTETLHHHIADVERQILQWQDRLESAAAIDPKQRGRIERKLASLRRKKDKLRSQFCVDGEQGELDL